MNHAYLTVSEELLADLYDSHAMDSAQFMNALQSMLFRDTLQYSEMIINRVDVAIARARLVHGGVALSVLMSTLLGVTVDVQYTFEQSDIQVYVSRGLTGVYGMTNTTIH